VGSVGQKEKSVMNALVGAAAAGNRWRPCPREWCGPISSEVSVALWGEEAQTATNVLRFRCGHRLLLSGVRREDETSFLRTAPLSLLLLGQNRHMHHVVRPLQGAEWQVSGLSCSSCVDGGRLVLLEKGGVFLSALR